LLACPHLVSLVRPVPAFQEDVSYGLRPATALAFVGVGFVDGVEVSTQADLACAHLRDYGADRAVRSDVRIECCLAWPRSKPEEFSAVLGGLPGGRPLALHGLADGEFRSRHEGLRRLWLGQFRVRLRVRVGASSLFCGLVGHFVAWHADVGRNPVELYVPSQAYIDNSIGVFVFSHFSIIETDNYYFNPPMVSPLLSRNAICRLPTFQHCHQTKLVS